MNILVANPSFQRMRFQYRVPEHDQPFRVDILAGQQVRLPPGDFSDAQKNVVLEQLERYGAVPTSEVKSMSILVPGSVPVRKPLVFSIEIPIKSNKLDEAREADEAIRQQISDRETEASGCATIPPNIPPELANAMRATQTESTIHIEQIQSLEGNERKARGGVDKTITVSKKAGARKRTVG